MRYLISWEPLLERDNIVTMNKVCELLIAQVLSSFKRETGTMPNTAEARALEFSVLDTSFEPGFKMLTLEKQREIHAFAYRNSFSNHRIWGERAKVSLTNIVR